MSKEERKLYDGGVKRMGETMKMCDYCITTTPALARELRKYNKEVFVNKNVASEKMVKLSRSPLMRSMVISSPSTMSPSQKRELTR